MSIGRMYTHVHRGMYSPTAVWVYMLGVLVYIWLVGRSTCTPKYSGCTSEKETIMYSPYTGPDDLKNSRVYINMVSLAISTRRHDNSLPPGFRICMPKQYVAEIAAHCAGYTSHILGGCFTLQDDCYVDFYPTVSV